MSDQFLQDRQIFLPPGLYRIASEHASRNRWIAGGNVRFWRGFPERVGGWSPITSETLETPARGVLAWRALDGTQFFAFGGASYLTLLQGGVLDDITPDDYVSRVFTISGVTGTWTVGETITGDTSGETCELISDGGTVLNVGAVSGDFTVSETITGDGAGNPSATLDAIAFGGQVDASATVGWGDTTWSNSVWGGEANLFSSITHPTLWTMDHWGEDLIACPRSGKIYHWAKTGSPYAPAVQVTNSPANALGIFIADVRRILVAYGAHDGSANDPVNIAWTDEEDFTDWTPTATNTAGSIRCETGNEIVGVVKTRGGFMVSTDTAVYSFRYIGGNAIFALNKVADGIGLIAPHAGVDAGGIVYFMGRDNFYVYDGTVRELPCDIHNDIFDNIDRTQVYKVYADTNRKFSEIWWHFPGASVENDRVAVYNLMDKAWSIMEFGRTSWTDDPEVFQYPCGTDVNGSIFAHERGTKGDGASIAYTLDSGDIEIMDGNQHLHVRAVIPDYERITGTHTLNLEARAHPMRSPTTKGPYSITPSTYHLPVRTRGRQVRLKFSGSDDFRLGLFDARGIARGRKV